MSADPGYDLLGSLIDGRYRVERVIGAGGFGTVYAASHVGFGAPVALKVLKLPAQLRADQLARLVGRFLDEARTLKRLRHPNIAAALDVGLLPADPRGLQLPYLVVEWCGGPTLKQFLDARAGQPLRLDDAWRIFEPLLDAMAHAHAEGVAHRDLKPGNVVLEPLPAGSFRPRVIDFGIAKIVAPGEKAGSGATDTASGSSPFTPRYAAPEQLAGARTGPWTDVHALALVFVEMVTGVPAFGGDGDAMYTAFNPVRPTPSTLDVDVGALDAVLARALALRPADRYPDASELARAMRAAAASRVHAVPGVALAVSAAPAALAATAPALARSRPTGDRTAPPSSRTLRTVTGKRWSLRLWQRRRAVASVIAAALLSGATAGALRYAGAWPFLRRFRDVPAAEIERRVRALDLGVCSATPTKDTLTVGCEKGTVEVLRTMLAGQSPEAGRAHLDGLALGLVDFYPDGAARFAIDDTVAVIVVTRRDFVATALDAVLGNALVDERGSVEPPPVPVLSARARESLAAWTGNDLWAAVARTRRHIAWKMPTMEPALVGIAEGTKVAELYLYTKGARAQLADIEAPLHRSLYVPGMEHYEYAIDGDNLLVVRGDPAFAGPGFLRQLLGGARAQELGAYEKPHP